MILLSPILLFIVPIWNCSRDLRVAWVQIEKFVFRFSLLSPIRQVAIGVDETAIRATMRRVSREDSETRCVEHGDVFEILTHTYLGSLAHEAERIAVERGRVALTDLSTTFKLPIDVSPMTSLECFVSLLVANRVCNVGEWRRRGTQSLLRPSHSFATTDCPNA